MTKTLGYIKYTCDKCGKEHYCLDDADILYPATYSVNLKKTMEDDEFNKNIELSEFEVNTMNCFKALIPKPSQIAIESRGEEYDFNFGGILKFGLSISSEDIYLCKNCAKEAFNKYAEILDWFKDLKEG